MAEWTVRDIPVLSGKLAIVTGATGGIGLETAVGLAGAGAEVVLAARNAEKGRAAEGFIRQQHPDANVRFEHADMASLASIAEFADRMLATGRPIDILVNNAGLMAPPKRQVTSDGFEVQFGVNYLSHFALTGRLLPLLTTASARIVEVASIAHRSGAIHLGDLNYQCDYKTWATYAQSKLAMLMFAIELDRRSKALGWGLTSAAAHPGFARTDLITNGPAVNGGALVKWASDLAGRVFGHSAAAGALPTLMAATSPAVTGGDYVGPQGWMEMKGPPGPGKISHQALDEDVARKLWSASEVMTGVTFG